MALTCPQCHRWYEPGEEPDPCLGELPGVAGACCGHGNDSMAYIAFVGTDVIIRPFHIEQDSGRHRPAEKP